MKDVCLLDFAYPCVAYVIRRLGIDATVDRVMSLTTEPYAPSVDLNVGDVVIWDYKHDTKVTDAVITMGKYGPITTRLAFTAHFGVYEGNGLVSDITYDDCSHFPCIRLMPLHGRGMPQRVLRRVTLALIGGGE